MANDRVVEERLGKEFVSKILDHASEGMEDNDLKQIARKLGETSDGPNSVLGKHKMRMSNKNVNHRVEMKDILGDFWNEKLYAITREEGRDALIEIFKSSDLVGDGNKALAEKLQELSSCPRLPNQSPVKPDPLQGAITPVELKKAVMEAIVKPSDPGKNQPRRNSHQSIPVSEFAENLAYDVDEKFGDDFKTWLNEDRNRNKGTESKVKPSSLYSNFINQFPHFPQARQWVDMWKDHLGADANLNSFIAVLEKRNDSKNIVAQLKKTFAPSS